MRIACKFPSPTAQFCAFLYLLLLFASIEGKATKVTKPLATMPKKAASAEVSRGTEDLIMGVLRAREGGLDRSADKKNAGGKASVRQLSKIWDELIKLGFDEAQSEMALRNAPGATLSAVSFLYP
jgi:hypothetical protein